MIFTHHSNREKATQIMFETFAVPAFYSENEAVLACYASGRNTGIMVNIGEGVTQIVPLWEGRVIQSGVKRFDFGGRNVTEFLSRMLTERGYMISSSAEHESIRDMKEKLCYVAEDLNSELEAVKEFPEAFSKGYELPDESIVNIAAERLRAPELLFHPSLGNREHAGIPEMVYDSIMSCDIDLRADLYDNVKLSGGCTMFPGFQERLTKEIKNLAPSSVKVSVIAPPERKYSTWIGGSILASLASFQSKWISKEDYDEYGPSVVHKKCFKFT